MNERGPVKPVKPSSTKRPYRSALREQHAQETRAAVLAAARALFATQGYAATTVEAIAARAGVAVPTVYAAFGAKHTILAELIDLVRDEANLGENYRALLAEPDPRAQLRRAVRITRCLMETAGDVIDALRSAGATDPEFRESWQVFEGRRRGGIAAIIRLLAERDELRPDLTEERATDILWSMISHELYHLLVLDCDWSGDDYEEWLAATLATSLLR